MKYDEVGPRSKAELMGGQSSWDVPLDGKEVAVLVYDFNC